MEVEPVYVEGCPSVEVARERIAEAACRATVGVNVRHREVAEEAEAAAGMRGKPAVLVAGADAAADPRGAASLSCRLYIGSDGYDRAPDVDFIAAALRGAVGGVVGADRG